MNSLSQNTVGIIYALIAYFLFIVADACYKYLGQTYTIYHIAFYTKLFASALIIGFMICKRQKFVTRYPKLQFYRGILLTLDTLCILYAYKSLSLTEVALIFYTAPFMISLLSKYYLKEDVGIYRIVAIIIGFIGMLIIIRPGYIEFNPAHAVLLLGVFGYAFGHILSRKIGENEPSINFTLLPTVLTCLCMVPFLIIEPLLPTAIDLPLMAFGGIIGSIAILMISVAFIKTHSVTVSKLGYTDIIWALLIGYIVFGDVTNDPYTILGGVIIILSGIYVIYREHKAQKFA